MVQEGGHNSADPNKNEATASFAGVTIKQEKITPPPSPTHSTSANGTYIAPGCDDKSSIGPLKSSSDILGELFQVFDAPMPKDLVQSIGSKKKHKKEKKSKKSRHKTKDLPNSGAEGNEKETRVKKKHRHGDRDATKAEAKAAKKTAATEDNSKASAINVKELQAAKLNERKRRFECVDGGPKDGQGPSKILKVSPTQPPSAASSVKAKPNKIVFKSLKNSSVFKNVEPDTAKIAAGPSKHTTHSSKKHRNRGGDPDYKSDNESIRSESSELSLSDEETYLRERNSLWKKTERAENPFYANESKVQEDETIRTSSALSVRSGSSHGKNGVDPESKPAESESWRFKGSKFRSGYVSEGDSDIDEDGNKKPFLAAKLKKTKEPIVMNIRNAVAIKPKMIEEKKAILANLSRHQHRRNEGDWVAVDKKQVPTTSINTSVAKSSVGGQPPNMNLPPPILLPVVALATPISKAPPVQSRMLPIHAPPPPPPPTAPPKPTSRQLNRKADYPQLYKSFVPSKSQHPHEHQHNGHDETMGQLHPPVDHPSNQAPVLPTPQQSFDHQQPPHPPIQPPFIPNQHELPTSLNFPPPPIELVRQKQQQQQHQNQPHHQPHHQQPPENYQDEQYHFQDMSSDRMPFNPENRRNRNPFRPQPAQPPFNQMNRARVNSFRRPEFGPEPKRYDQDQHLMHLQDQANDILNQYPNEPELDSQYDYEDRFERAPSPHQRPNPFQTPRHAPGHPPNRQPPTFNPPPQQQHRRPHSAVPLFHQLPLFHQNRIRHHLQQMHEDQMRQEHQHNHRAFDDYEYDDFGPRHPEEFMEPPHLSRPEAPPRPMGHPTPRHQQHPQQRGPPQQTPRFQAPHQGPPRFPGPNQSANRFPKPNPFGKTNPFASPDKQPVPFNHPNRSLGYRSPSPATSQQYHANAHQPHPEAGPPFADPINDMTVPSIVEQRLNAIRNREHEQRHVNHIDQSPNEPILHAVSDDFVEAPMNQTPGGAHPKKFPPRHNWRKGAKRSRQRAFPGI